MIIFELREGWLPVPIDEIGGILRLKLRVAGVPVNRVIISEEYDTYNTLITFFEDEDAVRFKLRFMDEITIIKVEATPVDNWP